MKARGTVLANMSGLDLVPLTPHLDSGRLGEARSDGVGCPPN